MEVVLELEWDEWRGDGLEPLLQQRSQIVRARACRKELMEWAKMSVSVRDHNCDLWEVSTHPLRIGKCQN
jgi:hypothetical protein